MGDGGSSSSSTSTSTQQIDKRLVVDNGVGVSSDSSTVNVSALDGGAIASAFDFASLNNASSAESLKSFIGTVDKVFGQSFAVLEKQQQFVGAAGDMVAAAYSDGKGSGAERYYVAAGALALVAVVAVQSRKGKK